MRWTSSTHRWPHKVKVGDDASETVHRVRADDDAIERICKVRIDDDAMKTAHEVGSDDEPDASRACQDIATELHGRHAERQ